MISSTSSMTSHCLHWMKGASLSVFSACDKTAMSAHWPQQCLAPLVEYGHADLTGHDGPPEELTAAASVWYHYMLIAYIFALVCVFSTCSRQARDFCWFPSLFRGDERVCILLLFNNKLLQSSEVWSTSTHESCWRLLFLVCLNHLCPCPNLSSLLWFARQSVQVYVANWHHWCIVKLLW